VHTLPSMVFNFPLFIFVFLCFPPVFTLGITTLQNLLVSPRITFYLRTTYNDNDRTLSLSPGSLDHTYHPQLYYLTAYVRTRFRSRLWLHPIFFFHAVFA